jgi:hypothetical protein
MGRGLGRELAEGNAAGTTFPAVVRLPAFERDPLESPRDWARIGWMARPLRALTCCALLSCSIGPGCGQLARISECKRFVRLANASTTELRAIDEANKIVPESATYEKLALRFERFAFDIDALRLADWELRKATAAINRTMQMAAKDCR